MRYLVIIMMFGMFGSIVGHLGSRNSSPSATENAFRSAANTADAAGGEDSNAPTISSQEGTLELQRNSDGHFYADVDVNGATVHMLVDTGATGIALSRQDARNARIATSIGMNEVVGRGADGDVRGEWVTIERITLGPKTAEGMEAIVLDSGEQSLLGQGFLKQFSAVEIHDNTMVLR